MFFYIHAALGICISLVDVSVEYCLFLGRHQVTAVWQIQYFRVWDIIRNDSTTVYTTMWQPVLIAYIQFRDRSMHMSKSVEVTVKTKRRLQQSNSLENKYLTWCIYSHHLYHSHYTFFHFTTEMWTNSLHCTMWTPWWIISIWSHLQQY